MIFDIDILIQYLFQDSLENAPGLLRVVVGHPFCSLLALHLA